MSARVIKEREREREGKEREYHLASFFLLHLILEMPPNRKRLKIKPSRGKKVRERREIKKTRRKK